MPAAEPNTGGFNSNEIIFLMKQLTEKEIAPEYREHLSTQNYAAQPRIEDVQIVDMPIMSDDGGSFLELSRFVNERLTNFPDFEIKQMNYSEMLPGVVKAAHLHFYQEDIWFVPPADRLLIGLLDVREGSATQGVKMRFVMGAGKARLLYIPRGVAHGAANLWDAPAAILYVVNKQFEADAQNTDEHRLPWTVFGDTFWELAKG